MEMGVLLTSVVAPPHSTVLVISTHADAALGNAGTSVQA